MSMETLAVKVAGLDVAPKVSTSPDAEQSGFVLSPPTPVDPPARSSARSTTVSQAQSSSSHSKHGHSPRASTDGRHFKETLNAFAAETSSGQRTINQYVIEGHLGSGNYATVELAHDREGDTDYAVKEFSKSRLRRRAASEALKGSRAGIVRETEVAIMKKVRHPNVAYVREVIDVTSDDSLLVVMELCSGGPIINVSMEQSAEPLPETRARHIMRQLVLGVAYLHYNSIVHRDIKPDNCLFMDDMQTVKIVDFGVSEIFTKDDDHLVKSAGSPAYMAPELLEKDAWHLDGFACDMWSLGVTLYALVTGTLPFHNPNVLDLFESILHEPVPKAPAVLSQPLSNLLSKLLERDPSKRATVRQLWDDEWLTNNGTDPLLPYDENCSTPIEEPSQAEIDEALKTMRSSFLVAQMAGKFRKAGRRNSSSSDVSND